MIQNSSRKKRFYVRKGLVMNRNIKLLIEKMTLEEKAGICSGKDVWRLKAVERLKIPSIMASDGPHGLRKQEKRSDHLGLNDSIRTVCFPAACATAASFDEELVGHIGDALGEECRAEDIAVLLGPAMNIKRSLLCGRNFEYFSEDPYLTGKLAAAQITAVQNHKVGTSPKHFAVNNQEYRRMTCSSELDRRTLHEIYLRGFEIAVKEARPWTIMSSYNKINGTYAGESHMLLTDILRKEWGFDGFVVSDWGAVNDRIAALKAGLDLEMPYSDGKGDRKIVDAVKSGELSEHVLDTAVERILNIVFRYTDSEISKKEFDRDAHHRIAAEAASQCAVLLKNNGILPLNRNSNVAYIGAFAKQPRYQGGGSSHINAYKVISAFEAAENKEHISYSCGFAANGEKLSDEETEKAVQAARNADAAVVFAGLPDAYESEGYDRRHIRLPASQNDLINKILKVQPNTVVVLHIGSPIEMPWAHNAAAILNMYLGGEGVGEATDALLYGDCNPSGKLPESFPLKLEDTPCYLDFPGDGDKVQYSEGTYVGYRYYDAKKMDILFPFGHGLSYTNFEYSNFTAEPDNPFKVSVTVKNTGCCAGAEIVQVYVSAQNALYKKLAGFKKVFLNTGESKNITIELDERAYEEYSEKINDWYCPGGEYTLYAAQSSRNIKSNFSVNVPMSSILPLIVSKNTTIAELYKHPATRSAIEKMLAAFRTVINLDEKSSETQESIMMREMAMNAPLRAFPTFKLLTSEQVNELVVEMNSLIQNYKNR